MVNEMLGKNISNTAKSKKRDDGQDENLRAKELDKSMMDGTTFFDEDESREGGSMIDEATGNRYNNSEDMDAISPEKALMGVHTFKDVVGTDDAEEWLKANDPDYEKNSKDWGK